MKKLFFIIILIISSISCSSKKNTITEYTATINTINYFPNYNINTDSSSLFQEKFVVKLPKTFYECSEIKQDFFEFENLYKMYMQFYYPSVNDIINDCNQGKKITTLDAGQLLLAENDLKLLEAKLDHLIYFHSEEFTEQELNSLKNLKIKISININILYYLNNWYRNK